MLVVFATTKRTSTVQKLASFWLIKLFLSS